MGPGSYVTTASGLRFRDVVVGSGAGAAPGDTASVDYVLSLEDGTVVDDSNEHGRPLEFVLGSGRVIPGLEEGVSSMRVGGMRDLIIPPELGYGDRGVGGVIPPNATLLMTVELVALHPPVSVGTGLGARTRGPEDAARRDSGVG